MAVSLGRLLNLGIIGVFIRLDDQLMLIFADFSFLYPPESSFLSPSPWRETVAIPASSSQPLANFGEGNPLKEVSKAFD